MNWEDTVVHADDCRWHGYMTGGCLGDKKCHYECTCGREAQAEISYKAAIREVVDYFFYDVGIVALMGCSTMEECKKKLPKWQAKLKEWEITDVI